MPIEHFDVVIVGAGLSGIGAACHLKTFCPDRSFVLLEARERLGGTWDLFRYPGVRSDSDMYTLGYIFKPWTDAKAIADGPAILDYIKETARENGIDKSIRYQTRVMDASWSSETSRWTLTTERGPARERVVYTCDFLMMCSGYYRYEAGYTPAFPGRERFQGEIAHPQHWTDDIAYEGKRVVVIGSGATAVTLVPALAQKAAHVTMLQRSPTYMASRPATDPVADKLRANLPGKLAYALSRWKNVLRGMWIYNISRKQPEKLKNWLLAAVRAELGPDYDVAKHFTPRYNPWDQRLCLVPDGDLFKAIRDGRASVVTDEIESFTEHGVLTRSGEEVPADLIVTATGLELQPLGNLSFSVDGAAIDVPKLVTYKGMMYADMPNLASVFGYTNASWTLKADLTCDYVCRLLNEMKRVGSTQCTPRLPASGFATEPWVDFSSGYFQRALARFPKQGVERPWKLYQNYVKDLWMLRYGKLRDGALEFTKGKAAAG